MLNLEIYDTMKDLKFKKLISGLGGAPCIICDLSQKDWVDPKEIQMVLLLIGAMHNQKIFFKVLLMIAERMLQENL